MPTVFESLIGVASAIQARMAGFEAHDEGYAFPWPNYVWRSPKFRRAHLDIVDVRETKKLYMLHLCIFPHVNDPSPVFGFDIIAGPSKVTGFFHDLSPIAGSTDLDVWFKKQVQDAQWSRQRELPDWAKAIFSGNMVAAGNVQDSTELEQLIALAMGTLDHYLSAIGTDADGDYSQAQDRYCIHQKQNPHTPRVMQALGFNESTVNSFINNCLFPELV